MDLAVRAQARSYEKPSALLCETIRVLFVGAGVSATVNVRWT
jgi:hypothetical protein